LSGSFGGSFTEAGSATIVASGGSNVISQSGAGSIALMGGSNNDTIIASGTGTIDGGGGNNLIVASGAGVSILSEGNDTISATGASATMSIVGAGSDVVFAGAGNDTVVAGTGNATVFGSPGGEIDYISAGSVGSAFLVAGAGNETINGSASRQPLFMIAGSGSDVLIGGSGNDTAVNGNPGGSTTMTGGAGSNAFAFFKQGVGGAKDVITDFTAADTVYIEGYASMGSASALLNAATVGAGGVTLNLSDGTTIRFSNLTSTSPLNGKIQYSGGGAVCYARGTRIRTPAGDLPIETLASGMQVITLVDGEEVPQTVSWIGHRRIDLTAHPQPETVAPVRIERDAFADGMPHRDLMVSPDHAVFVDGMLICARQLINGTTIRQERDSRAVHYYHVELKEHAILLAEGLPAESYIDTGNSGFFTNSGAPLVLHPDLTDEADYPTREAGSCAPFVTDEASVQPVWQRLADRAAAIGRPVTQRVTTTDAGLRLVANGRTVKPVFGDSDRVIFALPRDTREVQLVSSAQSPTKARPWLSDQRRLGVRVKRIVLRCAEGMREVPIDHPDLTRGWWAVERDGPMMSRWTDGEGVLPLPAMRGHVVLEIHLAGSTIFVEDTVPVDGTVRAAA
jgi:hypothetical protein